MWRVLTFAFLLAACSDRASTRPAAPSQPVVSQPPMVPTDARPSAREPLQAECRGTLRPHRVTLVRGTPTAIAAGGVSATYRNSTIDHRADGTSAVVLDLQMPDGTWIPDSRDRDVYAFGDHCVRLISSTQDKVELDVALQPDKYYDPARCELACCATEASQRPAPDGTVECCFCSDRPER